MTPSRIKPVMPIAPPDPPNLRGPRVILRAPREADKSARLSYGRDPEFRRMVGGDPRTNPPLTTEEVDQWYERAAAEPLYWIIDLDGTCIGTARLHSLDDQNRRARYAIGIFSPEHRRQGLGTEATRLVLEYAFRVLGLHRVDLRVLAFNAPAVARYEKCGFVREGIEREGTFIGGQWEDDVMMSVLEQEWLAAGREPDRAAHC